MLWEKLHDVCKALYEILPTTQPVDGIPESVSSGTMDKFAEVVDLEILSRDAFAWDLFMNTDKKYPNLKYYISKDSQAYKFTLDTLDSNKIFWGKIHNVCKSTFSSTRKSTAFSQVFFRAPRTKSRTPEGLQLC